MPRQDAGAAVSVERFFQFSLLGLVASGYLAVAGSGYLDQPDGRADHGGAGAAGDADLRAVPLRDLRTREHGDHGGVRRVLRGRLLSAVARFPGGDGPPVVFPGGDEDPDRAHESRLSVHGGDRFSGTVGGGDSLHQFQFFSISGALPGVRDRGADVGRDPALDGPLAR